MPPLEYVEPSNSSNILIQEITTTNLTNQEETDLTLIKNNDEFLANVLNGAINDKIDDSETFLKTINQEKTDIAEEAALNQSKKIPKFEKKIKTIKSSVVASRNLIQEIENSEK